MSYSEFYPTSLNLLNNVSDDRESPMLVYPRLAERIGLQESIAVSQLHYWLEKSKHLIDGHYWVYNTYEQWQEQFRWESVVTVKRIFLRLEKMGIVISAHFSKDLRDRTKWYRLNYTKLHEIGWKPRGCRMGQIDTMHRINLRRCIGSNWYDASDQSDPMHWFKLIRSIYTEITNRNYSQTSTSKTHDVESFDDDEVVENVVEEEDSQEGMVNPVEDVEENEPEQEPANEERSSSGEDKSSAAIFNKLLLLGIKLYGENREQVAKAPPEVVEEAIAYFEDEKAEWGQQMKNPTGVFFKAFLAALQGRLTKRTPPPSPPPEQTDPIEAAVSWYQEKWQKLPGQRDSLSRDIRQNYPGQIDVLDPDIGPVRVDKTE